jgi:hypothetical protein
MALVACEDCGKEVSDRAASCLHCGAPIGAATQDAPQKVTSNDGEFIGTRAMVIALAAKAVQSCNYKVDTADTNSGVISFTTGMSWGSWSGVSGSIYFEEVGPHRFRPSGNAKQNVRGGQVVALDLFGEAKGKVRNILEAMERLAS